MVMAPGRSLRSVAATSATAEARLRALHQHELLDQPVDPRLQDLARLAADVCAAPFALISLIDRDRQWFAAEVGIGLRETPLDSSICAVAIETRAPFVVADTTADPRFAAMPIVAGAPDIRSYAGAPLVAEGGVVLGMLCVLDREPRAWDERALGALQRLAAQVMTVLELRVARRRLANTVETSGDAFVTLDHALSISYVNRAAERVLGASRDQLVGTALRDVGSVTQLRRALEARQPLRFESRHAASGSWLDVRAFPSLDGLTLHIRDVTVSRESEQQLRLLETCVGRLRDCVLIGEVTGAGVPHIVFVNDAFVERTGYTRDEIIGKTPALLHGPDTDREAVARIVAALAAGRPHREEVLSYTKAGEPVWFELDLAPVTDASRRITHWISIERDVTARKAAEDALRRSEQDYRLVFASNPMPMWAYDLETLRFCAVNDAAITLYGYSREEFLAMTIADIRPAEDLGALRISVRSDPDGLGKSGVWRHLTKDGRTLQVEISSHRMPIDGRPARVVLAHDVTSELAAQNALRASEASLSRAQRIAHLGSWELQLSTNRLSWSDEIYRMFGTSPQQFGATYEAFLAAVHPDDREAMNEQNQRARRGEVRLDFEHRILTADGAVRWVQEVGELERDATGTPVRLTGTVLDITERKRDELCQQLEGVILEAISSEKPLATIVEYIVLAIEALEPTLQASVVAPDQLASSSLYAVPVVSGDGKVVATIAAEPRAAGASAVDPGELLRRMRDLAAIAFERDRKDRELRASEERFRLLATSTNDAVWDFDPVSGTLWWGEGVTRLFGVDRSDLESTLGSWTRRLHPDDHDRVVAGFHDALADGAESWSDEYRFCRADGSHAWVYDRGQIIRDEAGRAVRVIGGMTDVTERKHLEQHLLRSQRLESIGTLAGGIAHDLNNVLQPILMEVETLRDAAAAAGRAEDLAAIESCARRGAAMVRQLLSFARGSDVRKTAVAFGELGLELRKIVADTFPKNIKLEMDAEPALWRARANATEVHQLVLNLCVNARDAMPGGGTLTIRFSNVDVAEPPPHRYGEARPGPHILVEVSDTGTGMPPEVLERIFDPFFTTKEPSRGTGLGLSTVHAIMLGHSGFLTVDSTVGAGSRFRVYFPATTEPTEVAPAPAATRHRGSGETILVVDDEELIRNVSRRILERNGYRVHVAANGAEAIAVFRQERIAVVVLDLAMPGMDGATTVRALTEIDPDVRVIGASGLPSPEFIGAVRCFLPKPFSVGMMLDAIAGLVR